MNKVGITIGDPAGIGPELIIKLYKHFKEDAAYLIYGEEKTLLEARALLGVAFDYLKVNSAQEVDNPGVYILDMNILEKPVPQPSISSGKVAVAYLARAVVDAVYGNIDGLLTMPINKFWASRAGFSYEGQTEYLAQATNTKEYAMVMYSEEVKVVLLTTHIPVSEVPRKVKRENVSSKLNLIFREFKRLFGYEPKVGVLGLNPHAGELGEIGKEDMEEILPVVEEFKKKGFKVEGPLVPDTAFLKREDYDLFLCMYHDQGLIPFKLLAFEEGVNLTVGIPFPRTSPDHGTAYDIAWKGLAKENPSLKALELLEKLIHNLKA
ncbi:4-hydroxythreonine-4-phosphate dehydrogenase [Hydrogenivirga caldilitoris]|uniref:4-hydroxythreonine-4-phosphate dehydrogenase n=1 Tax=Hydrogenivirga caldilitoris TaxID=246264 RepID=A0A497XSI4_9AQUI|nr:4-hydroxythreonine-4-phosphate dehydrogenase [Hydrogenivirga caldilitoris]